MTPELEHLVAHWRDQLAAAQNQLQREPFAESRKIIRDRIANYKAWIARGESME